MLRVIQGGLSPSPTLAAWEADHDFRPLPNPPSLLDRVAEIGIIGGSILFYGMLLCRFVNWPV